MVGVIAKDMHPHVVFRNVFERVVLSELEEPQEIPVFLFNEEAVEHLLDVCHEYDRIFMEAEESFYESVTKVWA